MEEKQIDPKVFTKIAKLMALANDGGATEGEASTALAKAQEIMQLYNLTMAEMEMKGGQQDAGAARTKNAIDGKAMYNYQRSLMSVIAEVNFCHVMTGYQYRGNRRVACGYNIVGREANVVSTINMFGYLNSSIDRIVKPHLSSYRETLSRWAMSFKEGVAHRLMERLRERHDVAVKEQSRKARGATAAAKHPASGDGRAMVVVMEDYQRRERDFNRDFRNGWEPGTTARKRAELEAGEAEREAQAKAQCEAFEEAERERRAAMTEKQRAKEDAKKERDSQRFWENYERERERYWENRDIRAFMKGKEEGSSISLDAQVERRDPLKSIG